MSEKITSFEDFCDYCFKSEKEGCFSMSKSVCSRIYTKSWNAACKMKDEETEALKIKFSEATKVYTDEIESLQKENEELKLRIKELKNYKFMYEGLCK